MSVKKQANLIQFDSCYKKINHHLCDEVDSDDVEENMKEAKRWLDEEVSKSSDERLIEALTLFTSMADIRMKMCTKESFEIIEANVYLTNARDVDSDIMVASKVDEVVHHYATRHAEECHSKYVESLNEMYEKLDDETIRRAHKFTDEMEKILYEDENYKMYKDEHAKVAYEVVKDLAEEDPDKMFLSTVSLGEGIKEFDSLELFNKYLVEPCKKFIESTCNNDGNLIEALEYNKEWNNRPESDPLLTNFTYRFKICSRFVKTDLERMRIMFLKEASLHE